MERNFGGGVRCSYLEATSDEMARYPEVTKGIRDRRWRLPITLINGAVRLHGVFSPTFIQRDIRKLLGPERDARRGPRAQGSRADGRLSERRRQDVRDAFRTWAQHVSRSTGERIHGSFSTTDRKP